MSSKGDFISFVLKSSAPLQTIFLNYYENLITIIDGFRILLFYKRTLNICASHEKEVSQKAPSQILFDFG